MFQKVEPFWFSLSVENKHENPCSLWQKSWVKCEHADIMIDGQNIILTENTKDYNVLRNQIDDLENKLSYRNVRSLGAFAGIEKRKIIISFIICSEW